MQLCELIDLAFNAVCRLVTLPCQGLFLGTQIEKFYEFGLLSEVIFRFIQFQQLATKFLLLGRAFSRW